MTDSVPPQLQPFDEHNRLLQSHVHPSDWTNPTPEGRYNLVVIGAGTAGLVTAAGAAGLGARVALIERDLMGGDCLNVGCVPSKGVISAARIAATLRSASEFGIRASGDATVDFAAVMERMRRLRAHISPADSARRFQDLGVDVFFGQGRFTASDTVEVNGVPLTFRKAVIATGARAAIPPVPGLQEANPLTNETVFSLTELPRRLAVVGAGPIGCELAQSFARFGSDVSLVESAHGVLPREDRDAAAIVEESLRADGVKLLCCGRELQVSHSDEGALLQVSSHENGYEVAVDRVLVAAGRAPNVENLGLEAVGVAHDASGITVNDRLQTTNPRIYAAGDVCSRWKFTHAADFMARIVIRNALFMGRSRVSRLTIPWCTYTSPELAHVGLTEELAAKQGVRVDVLRQDFDHVDRAILDDETNGFVKVLVRQGSDAVVGATIVARNAGDMIGEVSMAMTHGLGLQAIANVIHPYPTQAEAIRKVGDLYNRTRLTPTIAGLFRKWMAFQRR